MGHISTSEQAEQMQECSCDGSGQIEWEDVGNCSRVHGTSLCPCRKSLAPRDGKAAWWTTEDAYNEELASVLPDDTVRVHVSAEVPISADNYRVHRLGNRYYPTTVDLYINDEKAWLWPEMARDIAAKLIAAANAADAIDKPDQSSCGHWAPCPCPEAK